jgi:hypothetical protein
MSDVINKIEKALVQYLEKPYRQWPEICFLSESEILALDKRFGGFVQEVFHCEIVEVVKRNWISFGER